MIPSRSRLTTGVIGGGTIRCTSSSVASKTRDADVAAAEERGVVARALRGGRAPRACPAANGRSTMQLDGRGFPAASGAPSSRAERRLRSRARRVGFARGRLVRGASRSPSAARSLASRCASAPRCLRSAEAPREVAKEDAAIDQRVNRQPEQPPHGGGRQAGLELSEGPSLLGGERRSLDQLDVGAAIRRRAPGAPLSTRSRRTAPGGARRRPSARYGARARWRRWSRCARGGGRRRTPSSRCRRRPGRARDRDRRKDGGPRCRDPRRCGSRGSSVTST